jgi:hypothetical protein
MVTEGRPAVKPENRRPEWQIRSYCSAIHGPPPRVSYFMKNLIRRYTAARPRAALVFRALPALAGAALLVVLASCQTMSPSNPSITVSSQKVDNDMVTIGRVVSQGPSWLVIHSDADGAPGPVLGWAALKPGVNWKVRVKISPKGVTPYLWAMLHTDAGTVGKYEFPGPDVPLTMNGRVVMKEFALDQGYSGGGGMAGGY